jgi:hypothetical protein
MDRHIRHIGLGLGIAALLGVLPGRAHAQFPSVASGAASNAVAGSSFATPTGAPFMNSMAAIAMSQQSVDPGTSALYFMATSQPGSMMSMGRINNRSMGLSPGATHSAKAQTKGAANSPGALASRYFNRTTPTTPITDHYYKRQPRQYPSYSQTR